jgi:hypothetical protein
VEQTALVIDVLFKAGTQDETRRALMWSFCKRWKTESNGRYIMYVPKEHVADTIDSLNKEKAILMHMTNFPDGDGARLVTPSIMTQEKFVTSH